MIDINIRQCEIQVDGAWVEILFRELKRGDRFRLWEGSGTPVIYPKDGRHITCWTAICDAFINDNGVWSVSV
jgi:hypothetical protein